MDDIYFLVKGLEIAGYGPQQLARRTQLRRFREMYGVSPVVVRQVWNDIQALDAKVDHLFWALCFLKRYPTEGDLAGRLRKDPKTISKWIWSIIFGIADLRAEKVSHRQIFDKQSIVSRTMCFQRSGFRQEPTPISCSLCPLMGQTAPFKSHALSIDNGSLINSRGLAYDTRLQSAH